MKIIPTTDKNCIEIECEHGTLLRITDRSASVLVERLKGDKTISIDMREEE